MQSKRSPLFLVLLLGLAIIPGCRFERADARAGITIESAVFEGGYGIEWHKQIAREYEALHPGITVNLWGDPRVDDKIKPRVLRRDPPDTANCSLPVWKLITGGKLYPLDEALDTPAYGQSISWRKSLIPGLLADFQYNGKIYAMPSNLSLWVAWYDKRLFRQHGWAPPKTWSEFTALCEKIKAAGIGPLAFQGKYPQYAWSTLLSLYQRMVPFERWYAMQDLKPGAFTDPEFIHASRLIQEMAQRYFEPGAMGMSHTESQLEWVNGRAAIVFCGLWLKNEMKKNIPQGFEMDCFPVPTVDGGQGDPNAIYGNGGENFYVFKDAKHPKEAMDFLKYMVSLRSSRSFMERLDTLSTVDHATDGVRIPDDLQGATAILRKATRIYHDRLAGLYLEWTNQIVWPNLGELLEGKITPEDFGKRLESGIESVRQNPDIYKPAPLGVPPLQ